MTELFARFSYVHGFNGAALQLYAQQVISILKSFSKARGGSLAPPPALFAFGVLEQFARFEVMPTTAFARLTRTSADRDLRLEATEITQIMRMSTSKKSSQLL